MFYVVSIPWLYAVCTTFTHLLKVRDFINALNNLNNDSRSKEQRTHTACYDHLAKQKSFSMQLGDTIEDKFVDTNDQTDLFLHAERWNWK
jgi:hypothetical protein